MNHIFAISQNNSINPTAVSATTTPQTNETQVSDVTLSGLASSDQSMGPSVPAAASTKECSKECSKCGNAEHKDECWPVCAICDIRHHPNLSKVAYCETCKKHHPKECECPQPGVKTCGRCGDVGHLTKGCPQILVELKQKHEAAARLAAANKQKTQQKVATAQTSAEIAAAKKAAAAAFVSHQEQMGQMHAALHEAKSAARADKIETKALITKANGAYCSATGKCQKCGTFCKNDQAVCDAARAKAKEQLAKKVVPKSNRM